jgi:thiosulfate/3-mercaptopyruvate sulfurtransferase
MTYANPEALVGTAWLAERLAAPDVRVVDATWFAPSSQRDAQVEYELRHIPGAVFFDIDEIANTDVDLPHMLPSPEKFASRVRALGLGNGNRIVVYDGNGGFSAACRVWWMFRVFGHRDVAVLDGGLPRWMKEKRPIEAGDPAPRERHFEARFDHTLVRDMAQMRANVQNRREQVIDARNAKRFRGEEGEPRLVKHLGHIPGSANLPFTAFMDQRHDFTFKPAEAIRQELAAAGIDPLKPMVASCGSGVTACVTALGLYLIGHKEVAVYDGSWAEWGNHDDTPIER